MKLHDAHVHMYRIKMALPMALVFLLLGVFFGVMLKSAYIVGLCHINN